MPITCLGRKGRVCICQICNCGKHRCPPDGVEVSHGASGQSEYRTRYEAHRNARPPASYKPHVVTLTIADDIEQTTTHRKDFVRHPVQEKASRRREQYFPPEGPMEAWTSYTSEFRAKPIERVVAIEPPTTRCVAAGDFDGLPTYRADFPRWPLPPRRAKTRLEHVPPDACFVADSNYRASFTPFPGARPADIYKPPPTALSDEPFDGRTNYREAYVQHERQQLTTKPPTVVQIEQNEDRRLDALTNYRKEFTNKKAQRPVSCRPSTSEHRETECFDALSTNHTDFQAWKTPQRAMKLVEQRRIPRGVMDTLTTSKVAFQTPPKKALPRRPQTAQPRRGPGQFEGSTSYHDEFQRWALPSRYNHKRDVYEPTDAAFDALPTYRTSYLGPKATRPTKLRPSSAVLTAPPFDATTEYRQQFLRHQIPQCPAIPLVIRPAGSARHLEKTYELSDRNDSGHEYYFHHESHQQGPGEKQVAEENADEQTIVISAG